MPDTHPRTLNSLLFLLSSSPLVSSDYYMLTAFAAPAVHLHSQAPHALHP